MRQDAVNQRHEILEYGNKNHLHVDEFIEAELERGIISERTKAALAAKKPGGKKPGKPKGTLQESKLDPHQERIKEFLQHGVARSAIARMLGIYLFGGYAKTLVSLFLLRRLI